MLALSDVLSGVRSHLEIAGFAIEENVALNGEAGETVQLLASRRQFSWIGMSFISQTVVVRRASSVTPSEVLSLCDEAFKLAKKRNTLPLVRGFGMGYLSIPCFLVEQVSPELLQFVSSPQRKRFAIFEFPVVFDLATGNTHYLNSTPLWGAVFTYQMRALANVIFPGARAQPSGPPIASPGPN